MKNNFSNPCQELNKQPFMHLFETNRNKARKDMSKLPANYEDELGNTILHYAGMYHDEFLLEKYINVVDINTLNNKSETPLDMAINSQLNEGFTTYENANNKYWLMFENHITRCYDLPPLSYNASFLRKMVQAGAICDTNTKIQKLMEVYASRRTKDDMYKPLDASYSAAFDALYNNEDPFTLFSGIRRNEDLMAVAPFFERPQLYFNEQDEVGKTLLHYMCSEMQHIVADHIEVEKPTTNQSSLNHNILPNHTLIIGTTRAGMGNPSNTLKNSIIFYTTTFERIYDKVLNHPNMKEEYFHIKDNSGYTAYDYLSFNNYFKAKTNAFYLEKALPLDANRKIERRVKV